MKSAANERQYITREAAYLLVTDLIEAVRQETRHPTEHTRRIRHRREDALFKTLARFEPPEADDER